MQESGDQDHLNPWFEEPGYVRRVTRLESACFAGDDNLRWRLNPPNRLWNSVDSQHVLRGQTVARGSLLQQFLLMAANLATALTERIFGWHRVSEDHGREPGQICT